MLTKKQNIKDNSLWIEALESSTKLYSKEDIIKLENKTIETIKKVCNHFNNICLGYSSGKDSLVIMMLCNKANIKYTPIMWRGINEWTQMKNWIDKNKPKNTIIEVIDKFNFDFLENNPNYLFCQNNTRTKWMNTKWERQRKDIQKYKFDLFITGRRLKDGNRCGDKKNNFIQDKGEYKVYNAIADWNHEQVLAYIKYNDIELPPFYKFPNGFLNGSIAMGEWTEYSIPNKSIKEILDEIYLIDKEVLINAKNKLSVVNKFLTERGN